MISVCGILARPWAKIVGVELAAAWRACRRRDNRNARGGVERAGPTVKWRAGGRRKNQSRPMAEAHDYLCIRRSASTAAGCGGGGVKNRR